jgi:hypothetical protein
MDQTAHVCNLECQDGNFIIAYSSAECSAPFKIGEMLGPFFTIVNLPVRDRTIVCIFKS